MIQTNPKRHNPLYPMDSDYCFVCGNLSEDRDDENVIIGLNPVIFCSSCNMGVHLKCVGLAEATEQFICDKCRYLKHGDDPGYLVCAYCASHYGYLFHIHNDLSPSPSSSSIPRFAHLFCQLIHEGGLVRSFSPVQLAPPLTDIVYNGSECSSTSSLDTIFKIDTMRPAEGVKPLSSSSSSRNPVTTRSSREKDCSRSASLFTSSSFISTTAHSQQQQQQHQQQQQSLSSADRDLSIADRTLTCQFAITGVKSRSMKPAAEVKFNDFVISELVRQENAYISKNRIRNGQYSRRGGEERVICRSIPVRACSSSSLSSYFT